MAEIADYSNYTGYLYNDLELGLNLLFSRSYLPYTAQIFHFDNQYNHIHTSPLVIPVNSYITEMHFPKRDMSEVAHIKRLILSLKQFENTLDHQKIDSDKLYITCLTFKDFSNYLVNRYGFQYYSLDRHNVIAGFNIVMNSNHILADRLSL